MLGKVYCISPRPNLFRKLSSMAVADIVVKQESIEAVDLESKILALCQENAKGITDVVIQQSMPDVPAQQRVMAINRLLSTVN